METFPNDSLPERGETLPNHAVVLEAKHAHGAAVVLCFSQREYVTWSMRYSDRACFSGHYTRDIREAVEDFDAR